MRKKNPLVSVVILNWNGGGFLRKCVKSVMETDYPRNLLETIVVDNGSIDGSARLVKKMHPEIKLIENGSNLGFCVGNNVGIKHASGDLIILLNNDTIVGKDWIKEIVESAGDPKVGIVGCRLYYPGTKIIQVLGFHLKFLCYWENIGSGEMDNGQFNEVEDVDYVSGAALAIKREVLEKIGLLDPRFFAYTEDADICYRCRKAGYRVVTSSAIVYHYGSLSWDQFPIRKAYLCNRNRLYLIMKHYPPKNLLKYIFGHPVRMFKVDLCRFLHGATMLQIPALPSNNTKRGRASIVALKLMLLRTAMFYITLLFH